MIAAIPPNAASKSLGLLQLACARQAAFAFFEADCAGTDDRAALRDKSRAQRNKLPTNQARHQSRCETSAEQPKGTARNAPPTIRQSIAPETNRCGLRSSGRLEGNPIVTYSNISDVGREQTRR